VDLVTAVRVHRQNITVLFVTNAGNRQAVTVPSAGRPGGVVRVYGDGQADTSAGLIPYCCISHAQLSYHGYKDAVKFFVAVPGTVFYNSAAGATYSVVISQALHESVKNN